MKLLKNKDKTNLTHLNKELNYIQGYWFDIITATKEHIGNITGYKIHIPLLVNDLLTTCHSFDEFKKVSPLCSSLLEYLYENLKMLEGHNGYLYFLNNLYIKEEFINTRKEEYALMLLQDKMDVIIYSYGHTEDFDPYAKQDKTLDRREEHERMLFKKGWMQESANNFFIYIDDLKNKQRYKNPPYLTINESPFEHWVKSQGRNWANSLWKGVINQTKFADHWKKMRFYYNISTLPEDNNPVPNDFLRELNIINFIEYKPIIEGDEHDYETDEPPIERALIVKYKQRMHCISYTKIEIDDIECKELRFGILDEEDSLVKSEEDLTVENEEDLSFNFDSSLDEPFNYNVEVWLIDFFTEFIERMYNQYIEDIKKPKSFFFYALNWGVQINLKKTPLL
ncbi:hypothetical protein [Priestia megaterium]|uniref:Uncharacterized protein n=1 Tax=Priestia megaterium TaxID=1404 RepID=A0A6M6E663_PRIMG|nr:hypothetical protein [Priestia megaterium]QJX79997.1 hypothetical protein FDZ14_28245 [Priestia megaterium]